MSIRLAINGFGRIGRNVFRAALKNPEIVVVAVNDIFDINTMVHLLNYDSLHGVMEPMAYVKDDSFEIEDQTTYYYSVKDPSRIKWGEHGIDIVAECTGLFRDRERAAEHLSAGARKVIISAPARNPDITIVMGVNSDRYDNRVHNIISVGSCVTNCLAPIAKVILENFGIQVGHMTSIHSYTLDQRLLDLPHKDLRRSRAATLSMLPTTTGSAKALALVLPELAGKIDGSQIRVPLPNVSLVDFVATVDKQIKILDLNESFRVAANSSLSGILEYSEIPLVSVDYNGSTYSAIIDAPSTNVIRNMIRVLAWFDNEVGFASRIVDIAALIGNEL